MKNRVDLHLHTTASDGTMPPAAVVRRASKLGVRIVAITDHDTMDGVSEANVAGEAFGVKVIPGIEISADYQGADTHVLGYALNAEAAELQPVLEYVQTDRRKRNEKIAARMAKDGIEISLEQLEQENPGANIGRPHFAQVLIRQGKAESVDDAFQQWLNPGCPYYYPRTYLPMAQAVEAIHKAGGLAVLAHPHQYGYDADRLKDLVRYAAEVGMDGIETYYSGYGAEQREQLRKLAALFGLFETGGSDFHGTNKPDIEIGAGYGNLYVPDELAVPLLKQLEKLT